MGQARNRPALIDGAAVSQAGGVSD